MTIVAIAYFVQYDMTAEMFALAWDVPAELIYPLAIAKIIRRLLRFGLLTNHND